MMNEKQKRKFDLEERLIDFAVLIIEISENLNNTRAGNHIGGQLVRSGTSPALHYGEAQSAESRNDFVHKLKILLKELRETLIALKIIKRVSLAKKIDGVEKGITECNELISIFVRSIETARKNIKSK
jgi:four helix bundle protein